MGTQPRVGFARVVVAPERIGTRPRVCPTGKMRYETESDAIEALVRVRVDRVTKSDPRPHESHLYPCERCEGWHLSSAPVLLDRDLIPERPQRATEPLEMYARRLENRIKEQRAQVLSLLATGNGGTNRETRKRIATLTMALGRVTELWHEERRNREALVERLSDQSRRWWQR